MRIVLLVTAVVLTTMSVGAQRRYSCTANLQAHPTDTTVVGDPVRGATRGTLGYPRQQWDPQRTGWDYGLPGEGLLIAHVDYHREQWSNNMVNTTTDHFRYDLVHADNRDYRSWDPANNGRDPEKYTMEGNLRNRYLSTSAYPWTSPETGLVNREFSDTSVPAATVFAAQADGRLLLSRPVTNIHLDHDRTISFDFMGDVAGIKGAVSQRSGTSPDDSGHTAYYDLTGRRLQAPPRSLARRV